LEQGFATGEYHEGAATCTEPRCTDCLGQRLGANVHAAALAIRATEIGVAELAPGGRAIFLTSGPQVAPGESAKDGGPAGVPPFPL